MPFGVNIQVGLTAGTASVTATGGTTGPTTSSEASAFSIDDNGRRTMISNQQGGWPQCSYLCDPCNDGQNWYATYSWPEVETQYTVLSATVTDVTTSQIVSATLSLDNSHGSQPATFQPSLTAAVTNTVSSTMTQTDTVGVTQTVEYGISFLGTGGSGSTALNYEHSWSESYSEETATSFSVTAAASVPVPAGKIATADLMLSLGKMTIEIEYQLTVSGYVTAGYYHRTNGHYIWASDVNYGLGKLNKPTTITATETLVIDFYANATIVITDQDGNSLTRPFVIGGSPDGYAPDAQPERERTQV